MELDHPNSHGKISQATISGATRTCAAKVPDPDPNGPGQVSGFRGEINQTYNSRSHFTLAPYLAPLKSPEKKKQRRGKKRSLEEIPATNPIFLKFIVLSRSDENTFLKVSPFLINRLIFQEFGTVNGISKMSNGSLLIEANSKTQSEKILSAKTLGVFGVKADLHKTLNTSRGMITCFDLEHSSDEEILEGLKDQGVITVRKFFRKRKPANGTDDAVEFTGSVMLTFDRPEIPSSVQAAFYKLRVRPYVPSPMRCFKCQKFGHSAARCKSQCEICICGYPSHSPDPCPSPPKCPNCDGPHNSRSKDCMEYKIEREIQKMKSEIKDLTFRQARALVNNTSYAWRGTYSSAVKNTTETRERSNNEHPNKGKTATPNYASKPSTPIKFLSPPISPATPILTPIQTLPSTSSTAVDEINNLGKAFSPKSGNLPLAPSSVSEADCLGDSADDLGGAYIPAKGRRKKGRPRGKKNGPKKETAESD